MSSMQTSPKSFHEDGPKQRASEGWLKRVGSAVRPRRLVIFPHAGGSAQYYYPMARRLCGDFEVFVVQYPHRLERRDEPAPKSIQELGHCVALAVFSLPDEPTILFGHSMGALVAYETARRLTAAFRPPHGVVVSASRSPRSIAESSRAVPDDLEIMHEVALLGGVSADIWHDSELRELVLPVLRADFGVLSSYSPQPAPMLDCDVVAVVGDCDPRVSISDAGRWDSYTHGTFRVLSMSGGHFYLNENYDNLRNALVEL